MHRHEMVNPDWTYQKTKVRACAKHSPPHAQHYSGECRLANSMIETAMDNRVVHSNPNIMHGTPVFVGTRVPTRSLWDYLEAGYSLIDHDPEAVVRALGE